MGKNSPFVLKSASEDFQQRQKSVFDQLNNLTTNLQNNKHDDMDVDEDSSSTSSKRVSRERNSRSPHSMRHFRGKESIFKRPQEPPITKRSFFRSIPDFKKNPHKWQKYSLDNVTDEDMSDRSNTKAALSFLNELKSRNQETSTKETLDQPPKILFRKVTHVEGGVKKDNERSDNEEKPSFRSSKVVMPEYVVGQKVKKDRKNKILKAETASRQLTLDHLLEDDE